MCVLPVVAERISSSSPPPQARELRDIHAEARIKLDKEITELQDRLISLKRERNTLVPIIRLHPEILQEIFYLVHISSKSTGRGKASLLVTWIFHTWREIAHNTSSLWSHIDFKDPEWIQAALSRTKNRDLEFNLNSGPLGRKSKVPKPHSHPLSSICLTNLPRITKLKVISRYSSFNPAFLESAPQWLIPAPILVELHLQGLGLPPNLFSSSCPSLRSLFLASCTLDWDTIPVNDGLKSLSITYPRTQTPVRSIIKLLDTTRTSLEVLLLQDVFDSALTEPSTPRSSDRDRIRMERIRSIQLEDGAGKELETLFNQISLPPQLTVDIVLSEWQESDVSLVKALVASRNVEKWPVNHLEIKIEDESVHLCLVENWDQSYPSSDEPRYLSLLQRLPDDANGSDSKEGAESQTHIQLEIRTLFEASHILPIFSLLPIHPLETVFFVGGFHAPQDLTVLEYIGKLGTVQHLRIQLPFLVTFLNLIDRQEGRLLLLVGEGQIIDGPLDDQNTALARDIVGFQGLQDLEVYNSKGYTEILKREEVIALRKWLEWRKWFGIRLDRFIISDLKAPPIAWMDEAIYEGLVGEFKARGLTEIDHAVEEE